MKNNGMKRWAAAALVVAVASCAKEQMGQEPGSEISFGAATVWENMPGTRTEYSGKDQDGNDMNASSSQYERIDWIPGIDQIRILCDQADNLRKASSNGPKHAADYMLTAVNTKKRNSNSALTPSALTPSAGNGLAWGKGNHNFFAMYPAPGMKSNYGFADNTVSASKASIESVNGGARISGVIPAEQEVILVDGEYKANMNYAYMYAAVQAKSSGPKTVTLTFSPLVTSFEFSIKGMASDPITAKLIRAELTSTTTQLAGSFTADLSLPDNGVASCDVHTVGTPGGTVGIDLPDGGIVLGDTPVKFTFLTLPVKQENLTLTLYFEGGLKRTLSLKNGSSFISVDACKKVYISNVSVPNTTWTYSFGVTFADGKTETTIPNDANEFGFKVTSYRTYVHNNTKEPISWEIPEQGYSLDGGATWITADAVKDALVLNTDSPLFDQEGNGSATATDYVGKCYPNPLIVATPVNASKSEARDLSLYDITGNANGTGRETANCYVITRPGWYKFPCVYGNAIKDGATNASAYTGPTGEHILHQFIRHDGQAISDPWIDANGIIPASAGLQWTDSKDLVSNISLESEGGHAYIYFRVAPDTIHEGNAVIALKDGSNQVVWSWHIWVLDNAGSLLGTEMISRYPDIATAIEDEAFTKQGNNAAVYADGDKTYDIMKVNLGFCERHVKRTVLIKYVQDVTGETKILSLTQNGAEINNPYYQWGRKDPMYPSDGSSNIKPTIIDRSGAKIGSQGITSQNGRPVQFGIQNPSTLIKGIEEYHGDRSYDWNSGSRYDNLWNTTLSQLDYRKFNGAAATDNNDSQVRDWVVTKSVYDPCPPGFKVATTGVFSIFNTDGPGKFAKSFVENEVNGRYHLMNGKTHYNASNVDSYSNDKGFYFYRNAIGSGETSFFPFLGFRRRQNGKVEMAESNYWTACPLDCNAHQYAGGVVFRTRKNDSCEPFGYAGRSYGMCIRPMADND